MGKTAHTQPTDLIWHAADSSGNPIITLYFFWSEYCPHCHEALPFLEELEEAYSWLRIERFEVAQHPENVPFFIELAGQVGEQARSVPSFLFCQRMITGFDTADSMGRFLRNQLENCHRQLSERQQPNPNMREEPPLQLPLFGAIDPEALSLPVLTLIIAGLDAFNPCAFFVLLFLLSLLVHARSRARMLMVGGVFVICSGLIYFLFMSAWLNVFLVMGEMRLLTLLAGIVAMSMAAVNIKDFFWFKQGVSLTIPDTAKPGLIARMRRLVNAERLSTMLLGAAVLALVANSYELLCTAGFPMVYTRILTLQDRSALEFYMYLAIYNVIYIVPLSIIVILFTATLGRRQLSEQEGRILKLASGLMMLGLGALLVIAPSLLNNLLVALGLLVAALALTVWLTRIEGDPKRAGAR